MSAMTKKVHPMFNSSLSSGGYEDNELPTRLSEITLPALHIIIYRRTGPPLIGGMVIIIWKEYNAEGFGWEHKMSEKNLPSVEVIISNQIDVDECIISFLN